MFGEVVLEELNKICNRKFKLKIVLKFRNNSMCSIEMKPLWREWSPHPDKYDIT